ncbi:porin [Candidatus Symbiobacter mobilis]|uniref:Outer membrane protein n=1 Tax=Candidatus Symbiobacter mobilis CR TaxID=946483 RepID=U5N7R8_9BURK|nr:porin [Candidatus Symbiobacter mobilis]AGX87596.1 outer membrane protein [Candidatus Symbiobacter mobilis CR]
MKSTLVALAALAASGAVLAESSVTLYGIVDTYLASEKVETRNANRVTSVTNTKLNSGGVNTSRWGLKGVEDLGDGMKALFDLQQGYDLDTGAAKDAKDAFQRQAWVGASCGFGTIRLGYTTTPFDDVSGLQNAMFDAVFSPQQKIFRSTKYKARPDNTIFYQSPTLGGFSGAYSYSLHEDTNAANKGMRVTGLNLTYSDGPISIAFAAQNEREQGKADSASFMRLGGAYNFGFLTAKATYGRLNDAQWDSAAKAVKAALGNETTEWQIGVDVPVSAALVVSASYAKSDENTLIRNGQYVAGGNNSSGRTGYGLGAKYTLSKRTFLYGGLESHTDEVLGQLDVTDTTLAAGMQHRF